MQRLGSLAARRDLGCLAAAAAAACGRPPVLRAGAPVHLLAAEPGRRSPSSRRRLAFAGQKQRVFSTLPGGAEPPGGSGTKASVSVVGIPDPLTWIRCKVIMYLIDLYFELDLGSAEFEGGAKQALVHISSLMSRGRYGELRGLVSPEMIKHIEKKSRPLSEAQRQQLAVSMDDIIFVLPEDISVVFDTHGRKFCDVVLRFWLLSTHEGPEDPEGTKIFQVTSDDEGGGPQKKLATAVYEFHRELTRGAPPDWTVTTVWHWHWKLAE